MTIIVMDRTNWNVQTFREVTSVTLANGVYTITIGTSSVTFQQAQKIVRIMES